MSEEQPMREQRIIRLSQSRELWLAAAAECLGTTLLVLLVCLPGCYAIPPTSLTQKAIASGLVVTILVQSLDHISGAMFNPAVTLAAVITKRINPLRGAVYFVAQLIGATLGSAFIYLSGSDTNPTHCNNCSTYPSSSTTAFQAAAVEALITSCLALANCASWDVRNTGIHDSWPLRIGATVAGLTLAAGDLTGASMNPVRSFGPVLFGGNWTDHWVYWLGPLGGSLIGSALYVQLWGVKYTSRSMLDINTSEEGRK